ncbi:MAG: isopeptide-forming domain-containing fimbrial protein [Clostridia bacterium]|nr:isopeptide-forming domain-containing fimbrial protein [Clostridia bacterium]
MKKLIALVLALALVMAVAVASAAQITIEKTNKDQVYEIYKLFDAVVDPQRVDGGSGISYKLRSDKEDFKATVNGTEVDGATSWFELDSAGNVKGQSGLTETVLKSDDFKAWAMAYGKKLTDKTVTGDGNDQTITGLDDGYYFITTTTGTLVTIDSIGPDETVQDKNPPTTIDKEITGVADGDVTTDKEKALAQVGTEVNFEVRIPIANGAVNYSFEDDMSAGLTNSKNATVYLVEKDAAVAEGATAETAYGTLSYPTEGNLDIVIAFDNAWLKNNIGKDIIVKYSATVNADAVIADAANPNKATIKWGNTDKPLTHEDTVEVWSAKITVKKVDGAGNALDGAGFVLKNEDGKYYKNTDGIVSWVDTEAAATEIFPVKANDEATVAAATFTGLANGTYTLVEKTVPKGYNKAADSTLTIKDADAEDLNLAIETTVTNNQGTELPSTGGIGTTIFYILGGVLIVGAAIILVARRKAHD